MSTTCLQIGDPAYQHVVNRSVVACVRQLLSAVPMREVSNVAAPRARSLLELRGLGREIWAGVDVVDYVRDLRGEWDR